MKKHISKLKMHPQYDFVMQWGKLISITGGAQVLIQIVSFGCGIFIIRSFSIAEYAIYTLANTMLGAMNILADGGIVSGVIAEGGKVWQDKNKLGSVIATGMNLRKKFAIGSVLIAGSVLVYLLIHNNASWYYSLLILLSLIPVFYANLSDSLLEIAPKLHQDIKPLQKNQLMANFGRLLLTIPSVFFIPFTPIAIIATGIPRIIANIKLKKISDKFVSPNQKESVTVQRSIMQMVKRILPGDVYNIFSTNITVWILSILGATSSIAQVGALFRIGAILSLFTIVFNTIIVPRYSRLQEVREELWEKMIKIQLLLLVVSFMIVFFTWLFSSQIIWLLGAKYENLDSELILTVVIFCLNIMSTIIYTLCRGRGWVINPILSIGINLLSIIIGAFIFNIQTLKGILIFNITISAILVVMHGGYSYFRLNQLKA
ncbi:polysaccharide biosynthesis protein [Flavobacterium sp. ANB]|uniref:lipopolysaccharide biosynthesis protein n=1 Tax=unclassified Flavobacterium TaxID=196869 RepID=UPI0012B6D28E|nr:MULTISPECIES: polysaccharide biosynthesis protein [unclassified Flavobacterium]MBF4518062.1 polysaccharide biosynthesis protein [Flavobacterium sp. ANB]MTD71194.1 polysaccharide biosynthesis protein [Flavobacterium sp. LC2016-13]